MCQSHSHLTITFSDLCLREIFTGNVSARVPGDGLGHDEGEDAGLGLIVEPQESVKKRHVITCLLLSFVPSTDSKRDGERESSALKKKKREGKADEGFAGASKEASMATRREKISNVERQTR